MARIVVAGGANLDRILRLDAPLRHGGRTLYRGVETRWGGGGVNTAAALAAFGDQVSLVARIASDKTGNAFIAALAERGIDTRRVLRTPGPTRPAEILVEPSGERTILLPGPGHPLTLPPLSDDTPDLLYIAARRLDGTLPEGPPIIAQMPADPAERRRAEIMIVSRSDFPDLSIADLRDRAYAAAGPALKALVVTDGANPVGVYGDAIHRVPVPMERAAQDTIGAGDFFAAGLVHAYISGASPLDAVREGVAAAQLFLGTRPI